MTYTIAAPALPSLPIIGSDQRFPIRRVFCIGRNYAEHAREMGASVDTGHTDVLLQAGRCGGQ